MAQAEAEAIQRITASLPEGQAAMYLLGLKYLEALPAVTQGKGTTIFLPAEASGVMGALGGMRELLKATAGSGRRGGRVRRHTPLLLNARRSSRSPMAPRARTSPGRVRPDHPTIPRRT